MHKSAGNNNAESPSELVINCVLTAQFSLCSKFCVLKLCSEVRLCSDFCVLGFVCISRFGLYSKFCVVSCVCVCVFKF